MALLVATITFRDANEATCFEERLRKDWTTRFEMSPSGPYARIGRLYARDDEEKREFRAAVQRYYDDLLFPAEAIISINYSQ